MVEHTVQRGIKSESTTGRSRRLSMVNPFQLREVLLAKHAQHVVLIHFPIALFVSGVVFDLLSRGRRDSQLGGAAYLNLSLAALMVIPTVLTGFLAWQFALEGQRLKGVLLLHLAAAFLAVLFVLTSWWLHWRARRSGPLPLPRYRIPLELAGVLAIGLTAHLGGFLSGVST
jgi:uncharacterized membrane protein